MLFLNPGSLRLNWRGYDRKHHMSPAPTLHQNWQETCILECLNKRYQFPVVFTRAANVYGPHQQLYRIIPRTVIYAKCGRKINLHGGGKSRRAFIHAQDVADATWKAAEKGWLVRHITYPQTTIYELYVVLWKQCFNKWESLLKSMLKCRMRTTGRMIVSALTRPKPSKS